MKTGVIDVGGGLRGIYASGVMDRCLDDSVSFDYGIGISAGSANLASYMGGQKGRNRVFYSEYAMRASFMSFREFIFHGSFINLDYVYGTLSNSDGEYPLNYERILERHMEWYVIATDAMTGKPRYFSWKDIAKDDYSIIKASCAIPFVCRPRFIKGVPYYDGALGDPVPVRKAFDDGCDRVVLILTRPADIARKADTDKKLAWLIRKKYPEASRQLALKAEHYNEGISLARKYEAEGKLLIVSPDDTCGVKTLTKDKEALLKLYNKGYDDGAAIKSFLS